MFDKHLKIKSLTIILLFIVKFSSGQSNYFKWSYGLGAGVNYSYTDVVKGSWGHTFYGTLDYHFTPFITGGLEIQHGLIQGGSITNDPHNRQFVNKYSAVAANFRVAIGEFIDYDKSEFWDKARGLYAGIGVGGISNKMTDIVRYKPLWAAVDPGYGPFPGKDKSTNLWVPINLGINFYINDGYGYIRYVVNVNAQSNFTFGEGLDGYDDSQKSFKNYSPDIYNVYSIGLKYYFGNIKVYRKTL